MYYDLSFPAYLRLALRNFMKLHSIAKASTITCTLEQGKYTLLSQDGHTQSETSGYICLKQSKLKATSFNAIVLAHCGRSHKDTVSSFHLEHNDRSPIFRCPNNGVIFEADIVTHWYTFMYVC